MKSSWLVGIGIAVVVLIIIIIASHSGGGDQQASHGGRGGRGMNGPMPVAAALVEKANLRVTRSALGTVTPLTTVIVRTQIAGQLTQIAFQEGQLVQKGNFLAEVDPRPYENQLEQAQGQLQRDQALLKDAQLNLARYQKLVAEDSIARQQLDTQRSLVKQYQGAVQTDQGQVDNAKLNLVYCHITAPVSGRVGLRQVDVGNYVQTGDANGIVLITQIQPIAVIFTLPEDDLGPLMQKMNAGQTLEVDAFDRTNSKQLAVGKLLAVDNQIDTSTGTVKLRAQFDNEDQALFPNQFVNVSLLLDTLTDVNAVPSAAVQRGSQGTYVYHVMPDSTVKLVPVKTGVQDGDKVQIDGELNPGDQVVVDGADKLKDGAKVMLPAAGGNKPGEHAPTPNAQGTPDTGAPSSSFVPAPENNNPEQNNGQNTDQQQHGGRHRHEQAQ